MVFRSGHHGFYAKELPRPLCPHVCTYVHHPYLKALSLICLLYFSQKGRNRVSWKLAFLDDADERDLGS